jgi:hypothetical protein
MAVVRWVGALLLAAVAVVHGRLWLDGYRSLDVIGPLFALDTVLAVLLAAAVVLTPRRHLTLLALAALAALAARPRHRVRAHSVAGPGARTTR